MLAVGILVKRKSSLSELHFMSFRVTIMFVSNWI